MNVLYVLDSDLRSEDIDLPYFIKKLDNDQNTDILAIQYDKTPKQILKILIYKINFRNYDVIITTSYILAFAICLRRWIRNFPGKVIAVSMNLSRKPISTRYGWLNAIGNRIFARLDFAVVHSAHEARLFADLHGLPLEKFAFAHWGYDPPLAAGSMFDDYPRPYFCMIGRNNRDHATFLEAIAGLPAKGVLIVPGYARPDGLEIPDNVDIFTDLDLAECLSCQRNALASLIIVQGASRGAGHITAVSAFHLGTPQIASDVPPLGDYLIGGVNALSVPLGDAGALRRALQTLLDDPGSAAPLAERGRRMAGRWMTAEASATRIADVIRAVAEGRRPDFFDPEWPAWRAEFEAGKQDPPPA